MRVLIIEDELRAANRLERLLKAINPQMHIEGPIESVKDGIQFLSAEQPDLIISDIQLADGLSFEIFTAVACTTPIIFTTAYDQYAINAFETNGIDYLLKPIAQERLQIALDKYERLKPTLNIDQLIKLTNHHNSTAYKSRFMIRVGDKIKSIPITDIVLFYSMEKGTFLMTKAGRSYVLEYALEQVYNLLDPSKYFKISRKYIISIDAEMEIIAHSNSRLKLKPNNIDLEDLIVAREKVKDFKNWLDQ